MKKINVLSLFDGISCAQIALNRAGVKADKYFSSEIDKYAIEVTQHNWPNTIQLGDITKWREWDINWGEIDLVCAGSPCQGFSFAGKQLNFEDPRSKLFFEFAGILKHIKSLNPEVLFLLENNPMKKIYQETISEILGVEPIGINSSLVSAQNRKRLYWTNIPDITPPEDKNIKLNSIIGDYDGIWVYPRGYNRGGVQSYKGKCPTVTTSSWQHNFMISNEGKNRKFTCEEVEQIQTIPVGYTKNISENQRYKTVGNGWTVDVIAHIFSFLPKKYYE